MKRLLAIRLPGLSQRTSSAPSAQPTFHLNVQRWLRLRPWGQLGVVALGILAVCPAFYFSAIRPAQERLDAARSSAAQLGEKIARGRQFLGGGQGDVSEQLATYYRQFPGEKDSPQWLGKLIAAASSRGISLDQGEYTANRDKVGRLVRFEMTLPVKGEYPNIRKFLSALPAEVPVVALEHVQFERQKVGEPMVQAKLSWCYSWRRCHDAGMVGKMGYMDSASRSGEYSHRYGHDPGRRAEHAK